MRSSSTSRQPSPAARISPLSGSSVARSSSSARSASTKRCSPARSEAIRSAGASTPKRYSRQRRPPGQRERDAQLVGDREAQVLHRLQDVGQVERAHRAQLDERRLGALERDAHLEPALERLELPQVGRHLLGRGRLAVEAAPRLGSHVALEQAAALARAERGLERLGHVVFPGGHQRLGQAARLGRVDGVLELVRVEVEDQQRDRPGVDRGCERDRPEGIRERPAQRRLGLVGVAQPRERHVQRLVAGALADLDDDLLVARDLYDAADHALEVVDARVEQVGLREVVEGGPRLAPGVRARDALRTPPGCGRASPSAAGCGRRAARTPRARSAPAAASGRASLPSSPHSRTVRSSIGSRW